MSATFPKAVLASDDVMFQTLFESFCFHAAVKMSCFKMYQNSSSIIFDILNLQNQFIFDY